MKLCKDCRSYGGLVAAAPIGDGHALGKHVCNDPRNNFTDFIDGRPHTYDCSWLRNLDLKTTCGPEGRWWEPKS